MKTKIAVAILLVAIFALSSIATIQIKTVKASPPTLTLSDAELSTQFGWKFDAGSSLTGITDLPGPGVEFDLANLGKAGICDDYEVSPLAGGSIYYSTHYSDFSAYGAYSMVFVNLGSNTIQVSLFMNTGFTNSGDWGSRNWMYDTFWDSNWITLLPHQSGMVTLDFSNVYEAWNIADDPVYTGYSNGVQPPNTHIFRLNEVSCIGFQVLGSGSASVLASGTLTDLYIDPPTVTKTDDVGSTFPVNVMLSDFANLAGFDIKLTWDDTLITETAVDYTTALNALWGAGNWNALFEASGTGYYELAAYALATSASNTGALVLFTLTFQVKNKDSNVPLSTPITFDTHKLADNSIPSQPITATVTGGLYTYNGNTTPDLEFKVKMKNRVTGLYEYVTVPYPYKFEFGRWVEVEVYATDIKDNSPLTAYNLIIQYTPESLRFVEVDYWGTLGTGSAVDSPTGTITVSCAGGPQSGDEFLLFTLTFHVEFSLSPTHIWKYGSTNFMTSTISISGATLTFGSQGTIPMGGITIPAALSFEVDFIRGDVDCNGAVTTADIGDVAAYYGQPASNRPEYDLNNDNIIDIYDIVTIATNYGYPTGVP